MKITKKPGLLGFRKQLRSSSNLCMSQAEYVGYPVKAGLDAYQLRAVR